MERSTGSFAGGSREGLKAHRLCTGISLERVVFHSIPFDGGADIVVEYFRGREWYGWSGRGGGRSRIERLIAGANDHAQRLF